MHNETSETLYPLTHSKSFFSLDTTTFQNTPVLHTVYPGNWTEKIYPSIPSR